MNARDDGGPAFPVPIRDFGPDFLTGMTLRDWFAGMAMQGIWANPDVLQQLPPGDAAKVIASMGYEQANAMLTERAK